jgi:hypothetical protein
MGAMQLNRPSLIDSMRGQIQATLAPATAPVQPALAPLQVANPAMDGLVAQQARFRIEGSGPLVDRSIVPATPTAAALLAKDATASDAVRSVLRLVEHSSGGRAPSSAVRLNGVSFALTDGGLGANTYRAHLDNDPVFRRGVAGLGDRALRRQADLLGETKLRENTGLLANVVSGWMNIGNVASDALLGRSADPQQLGDAVRIMLHESVHATDSTKAGLSPDADHAVLEALAEARTTSLPQLQAARGVLGLDGAVSDAQLGASLRIRPYSAIEQTLRNALAVAKVVPGSAEEQRIVSSPSKAAVEQLTSGIQRATGESPQLVRTALEATFRDALKVATG